MKKLLAIALVACSLVTSVFAKEGTEQLENVSVTFPIMKVWEMNTFGIDFHAYEMSSETFGYAVGTSISFPMQKSGDFLGVFCMFMDTNIGPCFRLIDSGKFSLILTPAIDLQILDLANIVFVFSIGAQGDVLANLKLTDSLYISGGVSVTYSFYSFGLLGDYSFGGELTGLTIAPRIGITYKN